EKRKKADCKKKLQTDGKRLKSTDKVCYHYLCRVTFLAMQVHELLQLVDDAVYLNTGKHLNDLQRGVIEGTLKYQKYADIAENCGCSAGHAKDVGYELLKMLSDIFGEPVDKSNLKSVLERQGNVNISSGDNNNRNIFEIGCINIGSKQPKTKPDKSHSGNSKLQQRNKNKTQIEKISKLRYFGLNDEQIAEVLELPLEVIKQVVSE
ncbi:MAG: hypothetical protein ACKPKC_12125, partial [Dolichospermum sp.]